MPLPFLYLAGAAVGAIFGVGGTVYLRGKVKLSENEAISRGKDEVIREVMEEISSTLEELLSDYEAKVKKQLYMAVICFISFCLAAIIYNPLAWAVIVVSAFISMNLLAEITVLYFYNDDVKRFRKSFWKNYRKNRFEWRKIESAAKKAIKVVVRDHIRKEKVRRQIEARVEKNIRDLPTGHKLAYNMFGSDGNDIVSKIYGTALDDINYDDIMRHIKRIMGKIIVSILTYSLIAFLLRVVIVEVSSLGQLKWLVFPAIFVLCFWWHKKSGTIKT